jgi:hypothetical protein
MTDPFAPESPPYSLLCGRCRVELPERWNKARCTPLPPPGGSELWVLVEPKEPGRIGPSSKYLCAKCTEDLREWFLAPTKDRSALGEGP